VKEENNGVSVWWKMKNNMKSEIGEENEEEMKMKWKNNRKKKWKSEKKMNNNNNGENKRNEIIMAKMKAMAKIMAWRNNQ